MPYRKKKNEFLFQNSLVLQEKWVNYSCYIFSLSTCESNWFSRHLFTYDFFVYFCDIYLNKQSSDTWAYGIMYANQMYER